MHDKFRKEWSQHENKCKSQIGQDQVYTKINIIQVRCDLNWLFNVTINDISVIYVTVTLFRKARGTCVCFASAYAQLR